MMDSRETNSHHCRYIVLLIIVHLLGAYGENQDVTVVKSDSNNTELQFSIVNEEIYYTSNYALAAIICLASSEPHRTHPDANYIDMCQNSSSNDSGWLLYAENNWAVQFRKDISELDIEEIEPIVIEKVNLMLGSYPYGYRVTLKDFHVHGLSNLTINQIKTNLDDSLEYQMTFFVPKLSFTTLSRVLIMFAATGGGEYWGEFEDIEAAVYINATEVVRNSKTFLHSNDMEVDFNFGAVHMGIKKTNKKNKILESALNLFINAYALEFLKEIKPCLKNELTFIVKSFIDNWFKTVPVDNSYLYCNFNGQ